MDKNNKNPNEYLKTKVFTASPEELQLMLYDGAIRFCEQARVAIREKNIEESFNLINKAEKIVLQLCNSMKEEIAPDICSNMRRLYLFCYDRLVVANLKKEINSLDDALKVLKHIRETWIMLVEKIKSERAEQYQNQTPTQTPSPAPGQERTPEHENILQEIGSTINFEG
jgi:flagellar protein FliS